MGISLAQCGSLEEGLDVLSLPIKTLDFVGSITSSQYAATHVLNFIILVTYKNFI